MQSGTERASQSARSLSASSIASVAGGPGEASVTGYTKLFNSILMSSIWDEPTETRLVWITLLALADQNGHVDGTVRSLARVARVPEEATQRALETFASPDPFDRSGVAEGRRLEAVQGGWSLINHAAYRAKMSAEDRRERDAARKRLARGGARPQVSANVRDVSQAEAEADQTTTEADSVVVMVFPTAGDPPTWALTQALVDHWASRYAGLDIMAEVRKAASWLEANHMKTATGMRRFLVNWLNRATNDRRAAPGGGGLKRPSWAK